jgi:hypothetical protein
MKQMLLWTLGAGVALAGTVTDASCNATPNFGMVMSFVIFLPDLVDAPG